ncbi:MAG: TusE/DsrC/DsvC family sulfur relay protein, partial [Gemmatimonadota bacterium]|nr:TusE/DsrC/DsvC family sulfur relay protein [Gemmatimonadota bacterium]
MAYEIVTLGGKEIEVDEDGFIQQPELWDEDVARDLARQDGIEEMSEDHWQVVYYIRNYLLKFEFFLLIRRPPKATQKNILTTYTMFSR